MSKENEIAAALEEMIFGEKIGPGMKVPSSYELAERFGTTKETANKALAGLVSRGLLERTRGRGGTRVVSPRPFRGIIGFKLVLLSAGPFCARIMRGAARAAASRNYGLWYFEFELPEEEHWKKIARSGVKGVLHASSALPGEDFPLPALQILLSEAQSRVTSDEIAGGRMAAELFLRNGHRHVAVLHDFPGDIRGTRIEGFAEAMKEAGTEPRIIRVPPHGEMNPGAVWEELRLHRREVTGLFCYSDAVALQMLFYLQSRGIRVPEDLSICGYGNMRDMPHIFPLTTVEQFPENLGFLACNKLIDIIEGKTEPPVRFTVPVDLINPRATMGPVPPPLKEDPRGLRGTTGPRS